MLCCQADKTIKRVCFALGVHLANEQQNQFEFNCQVQACVYTWWLLLPATLTPDMENVFDEASTVIDMLPVPAATLSAIGWKMSVYQVKR